MNFLAGPMTIDQIPPLNKLAGVEEPRRQSVDERGEKDHSSKVGGAEDVEPSVPGLASKQEIPEGVKEYFLPTNLFVSQSYEASGEHVVKNVADLGILYKPTLMVQASVRYIARRYELDTSQSVTTLVEDPGDKRFMRWEDCLVNDLDDQNFDCDPVPNARFAALPSPFDDANSLRDMKDHFVDWICMHCKVMIWSNDSLDLHSLPGVTKVEFQQRCAELAWERIDVELDKIKKEYELKVRKIENELAREECEFQEIEAELSALKQEMMQRHDENVHQLLVSSRRRSFSSDRLEQRINLGKAKIEVEESLEEIEEIKQQLGEIEEELLSSIKEIQDRYSDIAADIKEVRFKPDKENIWVEHFGIVWLPYQLVEVEGKFCTLPRFKTE
jgi:hypothetical protein